MKPPSTHPPSCSEGTFDYPPFEALYLRVLRDVADQRLEPAERKAAARALAFLVKEQSTERVITDFLSVLWKSLDRSEVARTLLSGLRDATGDSPKVVEWTQRTAGRAHAQRHTASFISAVQSLVGLHHYDGVLPVSWQLSLVRAFDAPGLERLWVVCLTEDYARRFGSEPRWVRTIRVKQLTGGLHGSVDGGTR